MTEVWSGLALLGPGLALLGPPLATPLLLRWRRYQLGSCLGSHAGGWWRTGGWGLVKETKVNGYAPRMGLHQGGRFGDGKLEQFKSLFHSAPCFEKVQRYKQPVISTLSVHFVLYSISHKNLYTLMCWVAALMTESEIFLISILSGSCSFMYSCNHLSTGWW